MDITQIKLVVFDMDGVVLDSEPLHEKARQRMFREMGVVPDSRMPDAVGKSASGFWRSILRIYNLEGDPYVLERRQYTLVAAQIKENHLQPSAGFIDIVDKARSKGIKIALASSSTRELVNHTLKLLEVERYFNITVSGDEIPKKKPAPDGYLKVLQLAGIEASCAIAVEDSCAGIVSAQKAGIFCYGYRNKTSGNQDISNADAIISRLSDILL